MSEFSIYICEKEVAKLLNVAVFTLQKHRQKRIGLPWVKYGRSVRYHTDDVLKYLKLCETVTTNG